jgi:glycosyltransferase involved in cell wall biosynthesis
MLIYLGSKHVSVVPCGVDLEVFYPTDPFITKDKMVEYIDKNKISILFSSRFDYYEKNYPLAKEVMKILGKKFNLIELKGFNRQQVNLLMNACDVALMTSISEGSPQFIKEAMACNRPIVSTNVGDVKFILGDTLGCYISSFNPEDCAEKILLAIDFAKTNGKTNGRDRIIELGLDSETVATKIETIYHNILQPCVESVA